ncbi:unnamed protein product, partial [Brachionus calyciflorus]
MCGEFGRLWRINFNPTISVIIFQNWSKNDESRDLYLNGIKVQKKNYWDEKFKKVQKALYSLNGVGCRAFGLEPKILARLDAGKIIDLDPFTEDGKVCIDALYQFYVSKITQTDKAELYREIVHLCDLFCKDQ